MHSVVEKFFLTVLRYKSLSCSVLVTGYPGLCDGQTLVRVIDHWTVCPWEAGQHWFVFLDLSLPGGGRLSPFKDAASVSLFASTPFDVT